MIRKTTWVTYEYLFESDQCLFQRWVQEAGYPAEVDGSAKLKAARVLGPPRFVSLSGIYKAAKLIGASYTDVADALRMGRSKDREI